MMKYRKKYLQAYGCAKTWARDNPGQVHWGPLNSQMALNGLGPDWPTIRLSCGESIRADNFPSSWSGITIRAKRNEGHLATQIVNGPQCTWPGLSLAQVFAQPFWTRVSHLEKKICQAENIMCHEYLLFPIQKYVHQDNVWANIISI